MKNKKLLSFALVFALLTTLVLPGVPALAANSSSPAVIDVNDSSGTNLPLGVSYAGNVFTIDPLANSSTITVTGATTLNTIAVETGVTGLTLTLDGVSITSTADNRSPLDLQGTANVTVTLADGKSNSFDATNAAWAAGIHAGSGATLTINGTGSLTAKGNSTFWGAGIGGGTNSSSGEDGGTITITDGANVTANGGRSSAGIGGGGTASGGKAAGGTITINGSAHVTATGGLNGAGIGGGNGDGGTIIIGGSATVNATGGSAGAGIGGGSSGGAGGNITISGGTVTAISGGSSASGIGGGNGGAGGNITIDGGIVAATGDWNGAGIGGGILGDGGTININGGTVLAIGGAADGAGIGGGVIGASGSIAIGASATVNAISTGSGKPAIDAASGSGNVINAKLGSAIGADTYLKLGTIILKLPANYRCFAYSAAAASYVGAYSNEGCTEASFLGNILTNPGNISDIPVTDLSTAPTNVTGVTYSANSVINVSNTLTMPTNVSFSGGVFTINDSTVSPITVIGTTSANTIAVPTGVTGLTLILNNVSITSPSGGNSPIDLQGTANVTLELPAGSANVTSAANANYCAGIHTAPGTTLIINGTGSLTSQGRNTSSSGAGIGGNPGDGTAGSITINGGTINAAGGQGSAGIGGSYSVAGGTIMINGGTVTATTSSSGSGAGIGGGVGKSGGAITIGGSAVVTATGGNFAAGIGGGGTAGGNGGAISIGGNAKVTATGGYGVDNSGGGAGIGAGRSGDSGTITITGTPVILAASYKGSNGKPAIDVAAVSSGSIINAILNSAISASANTYLQCNGNTLMLPAKYESFAFSAAAASQIKAYSDQLCNTNVGNILQTSNSSSSISVTALGTSPANVTPVKLQTVYAASVTVRKNGAIWTAVTPVIQLSTLSTSLSGAITGTLLNGVYSFTGLDTSKTYYVWDITNNYYTGRSVTSASPSTTVNYYDLTVNLDGGSGATVSGSYASGVTVSIDAGTKSDYTFNSWTSSASGTFGNASNASTTFTMPGNATTITATWTQNTYDLTVNLDGGSGATVSGSYASGVAVSIDAGTKSGYTFNSWTSSASGTFGNASNTATTFTMPGNATTITATWTLNGGGGGGGYSSPANNNTKVIVDNKDYSIGTENKNNQSTTATVDQGKLTAEIAKASDSSSVIFPVSANTNVTAQLVVKNVEDMAKKDMILTVQTGNVSYNLNTSAIDTSKITAALGTTDTNGIPFNVSIANSTAVVNGATVVVSPVEFKITAEYNGITISVDTFSCFVNRIIEITAEQASKITTAVVVQPDGSIRHVPTKVTVVNGKYYAVINSLTNSTYTAVWHPIEFSDVAASWAKASINDMGSRMIVTGVGNNHYEPERDITRAEFAAIVVRALGLAPGTGKSAFSDVDSGAWYCGYIATASAYGIVQGYSATTFGPNDAISREQAMTMLSRAVEIAGIKPELSDSDISALIEKYSDGTAASDYAKPSIGVCLKTGIITGRTSRELAPKDCITRAEVAVVVQRLLQKSELI